VICVDLVIPVHNEALILENKVNTLLSSSIYPIHKIILIENGSKDASWELCQKIAHQHSAKIIALKSNIADMGEALMIGIRRSYQEPESTHFLLTAADLPFEFSDFDGFLKTQKELQPPAVVIGSKSHPQSVLERSPIRILMTLCYRWIRWMVLGLSIGDTQGTFFVSKSLPLSLIEKTRGRGFFFTTELTYHLQRAHQAIVEVPITLKPNERKSSVRIFRDSYRMLKEIFKLRLRN
jgi:dolichyl-phosphate beta-glucosyltransferase